MYILESCTSFGVSFGLKGQGWLVEFLARRFFLSLMERSGRF